MQLSSPNPSSNHKQISSAKLENKFLLSRLKSNDLILQSRDQIIQSLEDQNKLLLEMLKEKDAIIRKQAEHIRLLTNSQQKTNTGSNQANEDVKDVANEEEANNPLFDTSSIHSLGFDEMEDEEIKDLKEIAHNHLNRPNDK
eukprot:CAMPEP_0168337788 /NCGR_PEP_ID=MMETSP0213-20121227/12413_1 /TAXON_ID=151035 /ORGANISM="Euplotes harpa, Strain FSP1.4" /LENGTH=141 /DNA_ID=CAMNT_0008343373 /DNA_START=535 /DNA_END=960 /DNA_ORIENTATION=+